MTTDPTPPDPLAPIHATVRRLPHLKGRSLADLVRANRARRAGVTLGRAMREATRRGGSNQQETT